MSTATLQAICVGFTNYGGTGQTLVEINESVGNGSLAPTGTFDSDLAAIDGVSVSLPSGGGSLDFAWHNVGTVPVDATVVSVNATVTVKSAGGTIAQLDFNVLGDTGFGQVPFVGAVGSSVAAFTSFSTGALTTNPATSAAWTPADLFPATPAGPSINGFFEVGCDLGTGPGHIDCVTLLVTFTAGSWWFNPTSNHYVFAAESPGDPFVASSAPAPTITGVDPRFT
ncbi:MAG TPA: hypothetical protein VNG89_05440 [Vicinamibacterales bacterium]|nr:hypothetical protein [Vicinamibacterales bacterium]